MQNFLIEYFDDVIIYATENRDGDVKIKFIEYTRLPESLASLEILKYNDFKYGYIRLGKFESRAYKNFVYCRIYANLYRIDVAARTYKVIETDFCGICFMENYILIAKDNPSESFYKLIPPGEEMADLAQDLTRSCQIS